MQKNSKHSEKAKKKISKALSGINHPNFGKCLSEKTKDKISESHKGKICRKLKSGQWSEKYDCCQKCGITSRPHYCKGYCLRCYEIKTYHERRNHYPYRYWASGVLRLHRRRGFTINISVDDLERIAKETIYCPICKCKLCWTNPKSFPSSPTLDRINNENFLNEENSWIICYHCNCSKQDRTIKEFIEYCKIVAKYEQ